MVCTAVLGDWEGRGGEEGGRRGEGRGGKGRGGGGEGSMNYIVL